MKKGLYFSHDVNARQDEKIIELLMEHGAEGYGVFWMLVESLANANAMQMQCKWNALAYNMRVDASLVEDVVCNYGLFEIDSQSNTFYSKSLCERMSLMNDIRQKRADAANARWDKERCKSNANAMQVQCKCTDFEMQNKIKEKKKENNIKEKSEKKESTHEDDVSIVLQGIADFYESMGRQYFPNGYTTTSACRDLLPKLRKAFGEDFEDGWRDFLKRAYNVSSQWLKNNYELKFINDDFTTLYNKAYGKVENDSAPSATYKREYVTPSGIRLGVKEWIENGRRTYGDGKYEIPMDAPARPSEKAWWDKEKNMWNYA